MSAKILVSYASSSLEAFSVKEGMPLGKLEVCKELLKDNWVSSILPAVRISGTDIPAYALVIQLTTNDMDEINAIVRKIRNKVVVERLIVVFDEIKCRRQIYPSKVVDLNLVELDKKRRITPEIIKNVVDAYTTQFYEIYKGPKHLNIEAFVALGKNYLELCSCSYRYNMEMLSVWEKKLDKLVTSISDILPPLDDSLGEVVLPEGEEFFKWGFVSPC